MTSSVEIEPGNFITPSGATHCGIIGARSLQDIWSNIGPSVGYLKPDGWRFQIHIQKSKITLFSREGKDWTEYFPSTIKTLSEDLNSLTAVLDAEIVGFDTTDQHVSPSRILSAPKHICTVLDGLYLNGESIVRIPVENRIEMVRSILSTYMSPGLRFATYTSLNNEEQLQILYNAFVQNRKSGYDGIIVKRKGTGYFTKALKLKSEITIDCVIIGGYGAKDKVIAFLLAVFDNPTGNWIPVGKVTGNGEDWDEICKACLSEVVEAGPFNILSPPTTPTFWITPNIVVQTSARSISNGARGSYILRVDAPRNVIIRHDKTVNTANTFDQLLEIGGIQVRPVISRGLFSK